MEGKAERLSKRAEYYTDRHGGSARPEGLAYAQFDMFVWHTAGCDAALLVVKYCRDTVSGVTVAIRRSHIAKQKKCF